MMDDPEQRLIQPRSEDDAAALCCLMRLRGEGNSLDQIAAGLRAETGMDLATDAIDRVLRQVAGPAARAEGGAPEYFSGYLGGG
jgi:hypothetical protein